jgi:HEAT repeat protein
LRSRDLSTVSLATIAVQRIGGERVMRTLLDALDANPHPSPRRRIVDALGTIDHPEVFERLSGLVTEPGEVGRSAIGGLARWPRPAVFDRLVTALLDQDLADNVDRAEESLSRMIGPIVTGEDPSIAEAEPADPLEAFRRRYLAPKKPTAPVDARAVAALRRLAAGDVANRLRGQAIEALGELGGPEAAETLRRCLDDTNDDIRLRATRNYLRLDRSPSTAVVDRALGDSVGGIRALGIGALSRAGDDSSTGRLRKWLSDESGAVRLAALRALAAQDRTVLGQGVADADDEVRAAMVDLALSLDDRSVAGALVPLLTDSDGRTRKRTARLLRHWEWDGEPLQIAISAGDWTEVERLGAAAAGPLLRMLSRGYPEHDPDKEEALAVLERVVARHGREIPGPVLREGAQLEDFWGEVRDADGDAMSSRIDAHNLRRACQNALRGRRSA